MNHTVVKAGLDLSALGILAAWWVDKAPAIATTLTILWIGYCLIEATYKFFKWLKKD